jgi:hypothetical protein
MSSFTTSSQSRGLTGEISKARHGTQGVLLVLLVFVGLLVFMIICAKGVAAVFVVLAVCGERGKGVIVLILVLHKALRPLGHKHQNSWCRWARG